MTDRNGEALAKAFEDNRKRLRAVAFRMLGSRSEADDALQETWLRLSRSDAGQVENLGAWLKSIGVGQAQVGRESRGELEC